LFPPHFVQTTFPRIGGRVIGIEDTAAQIHGVALLFPRSTAPQRTWTIWVAAPTLSDAALMALLQPLIAPDHGVLYRAGSGRQFTADSVAYGAYTLGAPSAEEVHALAQIQQQVWGVSAGALYPTDLHSAEFAPGSSLVARHDGMVVGMLFGFTRFTPPSGLHPATHPISLESQLLAVAPEHRRSGLAAALKYEQARRALQQGIRAIHWTTDPLQAGNAALNIATLGAVAGSFYVNYYPFSNALNRTTASRLGMLWLPEHKHHLPTTRTLVPLTQIPGVVILNRGPQQCAVAAGAPAIALELPRHWTALQQDDPVLAQQWRTTTDAILADVVGFTLGRYVISAVAQDAERRYLIGTTPTPAQLPQ
jgi:predicted GNAT superfamily acetyltransferase